MMTPDDVAQWYDLAAMAGAIDHPEPGVVRITRGGLIVAAVVLNTMYCALEPEDGRRWPIWYATQIAREEALHYEDADEDAERGGDKDGE